MKILTTKNIKIKTDMFFNIIDWDKNGMFNFEEVNEVCKLSFGKYNLDEGLEFIDELAYDFTVFIFKAFNTNLDAEIPLETIKNEILDPNSQHITLLAMFCGAEEILIPEMKTKVKSN